MPALRPFDGNARPPARRSLALLGMLPLAWMGLLLPGPLGTPGHSQPVHPAPPGPAAPYPVPPRARPLEVRGIYLPTGRLLQGLHRLEWETWRLAGLNAIVVDLKNDEGWVLTPRASPVALAWGTAWRPGLDLDGLVEAAHARGFKVIARIVALKDTRTARARPALALRSLDGGLWLDATGQAWLNPQHPEVRRYLTSLAAGAASIGFDEVHLDYVRLPSEGALGRIDWPAPLPGSEAVTALVAEVARALEPTGVPVSVAIFGQSCVLPGDMGIGQQCEALAAQVPTLSPMAYPSHYAPGSFGLARPEAAPGPTVRRTLEATGRRVELARVRPWLQAFSLHIRYGPRELAEQIRAAQEAGTGGWLLWNARGRYPHLTEAVALAGPAPLALAAPAARLDTP